MSLAQTSKPRFNNDAIDFFKNYARFPENEHVTKDTDRTHSSSDGYHENVKHAIALRKSKSTHSDFYILLKNVNDQIAAFKTIFLTKTPKFMMHYERSPQRDEVDERHKHEHEQQRRKKKLENLFRSGAPRPRAHWLDKSRSSFLISKKEHSSPAHHNSNSRQHSYRSGFRTQGSPFLTAKERDEGLSVSRTQGSTHVIDEERMQSLHNRAGGSTGQFIRYARRRTKLHAAIKLDVPFAPDKEINEESHQRSITAFDS